MSKLRVYVACKMTHRYQDELVMEAEQITRMLKNYGYEVLHPVLIENVERTHELLEQTDAARLEKYWQRDKQCLQECHLVLDDRSCNKSDGVGVELGLTRFCYFKPVVRVFPNAGICISKLEYDNVFDDRAQAVMFMAQTYGTKKQLLIWRLKMLWRSLPKWVWFQVKFLVDLL